MLNKNNVHSLITEQIKDVENALVSFESFMRAATTPETAPATLNTLMVGVMEAENTADVSLRCMIDGLNQGSFLPATRESLISIATSCDKIANKCETVAKVIAHQHFLFPAAYTEDVMNVLSITHKQFELLEDAISKLFSKLNVLQQDPSVLDEIRALESQVDKIEDNLNESLFQMDIDLAKKLQTTQIIGLLCDVSDIIEDIADQIQIMLIARKA